MQLETFKRHLMQSLGDDNSQVSSSSSLHFLFRWFVLSSSAKIIADVLKYSCLVPLNRFRKQWT